MAEPWVVLKFGGTSVAGRPQWESIAARVRERRAFGYRVLVVCSAASGITDSLQALARETGHAGRAIDAIMARHVALADELEVEATDILKEGRSRLAAAHQAIRLDSGPAPLALLLAQGEWLSTRLGERFLARDLAVQWVNARETLSASKELNPDSRRAWLSARCEAGPDEAIQAAWSHLTPVLITQGYVASNADGRTVLLGRGGSDTSAALLASRLNAERIEIWTDVDGLYSADPGQFPRSRLIEDLAWDEALEMAAGGAKVVHGRCIRAAAAAGIPVWIRNTRKPNALGTQISPVRGKGPPGIHAVTCQAGMAVLLLENLDTRQQVGFLASVFERVAGQGVSVDLVATSETTTTLAINREANLLDDGGLAKLVADLTAICQVEVFADCACVNLVGRDTRVTLSKLAPAEEFFRENSVLMVSQSANDLSISLLVRADAAAELVSLLHRELVLKL